MIWARFDDSIPLLVGGVTGSGRVLWANTSADTAWNEWPKHKTFVPWLHNAVQFLAARADAEPLRMGSDFAAGTDQEMELGPTARKAALRVRGPGGTETNLVADDAGRLDLNLTKPGLYSVRDAGGKELHRFAVNVPASESDLAALRPADFQQQVLRAPDTGPDTLAAGLFGPVRNQKEFWRVLLLTALALLFVETIFSNRSHA